MTAPSGTGLIAALDRVVYHVTRWAAELAALVCAFLIAATTAAVIVYQQASPSSGSTILRMLLIWLVYLGSVSVCFNNDHITMDAVYVRFPPRVRRAIDFAVALLGIALRVPDQGRARQHAAEIGYGMLLPSGYLPSCRRRWPSHSASRLMALAYLSYLYAVVTNRRQRQANAPQDAADGLQHGVLTAIAIGAFALLFLGIPMWMIFLVLAIAAMTWQGVSMEVVVQGLIGTINNLVLLSVPGFIFAGSVMGRGGMAARLINWISSFLGRVPGGMALTTITSAELFARFGSSAATVAALGNVLYQALLRLGYDQALRARADHLVGRDRHHHSAQHHHDPVLGDDQCVGRPAVPGRLPARHRGRHLRRRLPCGTRCGTGSRRDARGT